MGKEKKERLYVLGDKRPSRIVKHTGLYDFKELTTNAKAYLKDLEYSITDKKHEEKSKPLGKQIEVTWKAERNVTAYVKYTIEFEIIIIQQTDVMHEGKKVQQGAMEVLIKAYMDKNYNKRYKETKMNEMARQIYEKFVVGNILDSYEEKLGKEAEGLIKLIKGVCV